MPLVATRGGASAFGLGWSAAGAGEELGGMVLLKPTSIAYSGTSASIGANGPVEFTAVTSLSLNGVFSADYDNYMVTITCKVFTGDGTLRTLGYQLRASGTDTGFTNYTNQYIDASSTTISASRSFGVGYLGGLSETTENGIVAHFYGPYLSEPTAVRGVNICGNSNARIIDQASTHSLSSSYDGFTISIGGSYRFSGVVSVFGLVGA